MSIPDHKEYQEGGVIVREGETGDTFYLIGSGSVRLFVNFGKPGQVELATLGAQDFFGGKLHLGHTAPGRNNSGRRPDHRIPHFFNGVRRLQQNMPAQHCILQLNVARELRARHSE